MVEVPSHCPELLLLEIIHSHSFGHSNSVEKSLHVQGQIALLLALKINPDSVKADGPFMPFSHSSSGKFVISLSFKYKNFNYF